MKRLKYLFPLLFLLPLLAMAPPRENVPPGHFEQPPLDEPWEINPGVEEEVIWQYENTTGCGLIVKQWLTIVPDDGGSEITYDFAINLLGGFGELNLSAIREMGFAGSGIINRASMAIHVNGATQPLYVLAGENRRIVTPYEPPCNCIHVIADYTARIIRFIPC